MLLPPQSRRQLTSLLSSPLKAFLLIPPSDHEMLQKYKLKLDDTLLAEDHQMALYDDLIQNHDAKLIPGGAAQNTARGAQYMLPADSVVYVGAVGDDEYSKILREKCKEQGMKQIFLPRRKGRR